MDTVARSTRAVTAMAGLDQASRDSSLALYVLLVAHVKGKAALIMRNTPERNGLLAWQRLYHHYEPAIATRTVSVLQGLLNPTFRADTLLHWEEDWMAWEARVLRYERDSGAPLGGSIKAAVILPRVPAPIQPNLQVQADRLAQDY
eukprot:2368808-Amphidinium_carterae.1